MSWATWSWLKKYAQWRHDYLEENPDKQLFSWLFGGLKSIPAPEDPVITLGEKGKKIGVVLLVGLVLLTWSSDS